MFPAILDLSALKVAVAGSGPAAVRRVHLLDEAGVRHLQVFAPEPGEEMASAAGPRLVTRLPDEGNVAALHILFTAGLPELEARRLAIWARTHGTLVNTEDVRSLCDFHVPAMVRRGDLLLTISTGGKSPGLARRLRQEVERRFDLAWAERLDELARSRECWRGEGVPPDELMRRTEALIDERGWLP
jgi:precorrin-2 dehydrogenase / sirohydrochlorin ferrochelatase